MVTHFVLVPQNIEIVFNFKCSDGVKTNYSITKKKFDLSQTLIPNHAEVILKIVLQLSV